VADDNIKQPWHRFRDAITSSTGLLQQGKGQEALTLMDESIAQAIRENEAPWIRALSHHAAIIAKVMGNQQLAGCYYRQSLAFVPENPRALYGLAEIERERGELETAREYAARCYKAIVQGDDEITKQGLLDLVIKHWPEVADK
jgi:Flp pilus assembly protein TadD